MKLIAYCGECRHKHPVEHNPDAPDNQCSDWYTKHHGHKDVGFQWPERSPKGRGITTRLVRHGRFVRHPRGHHYYAAKPVHAGPQPWPLPRNEVFRPVAPHDLFAFVSNANVNVSYVATVTPTLTLASLAASSTLLAGRESTAVTNASNKYLDYLVAGNFRAGAANNQAGTIRTAVIGARDDTPSWPDVFDGTDSVETVTDQPVYDSICRVISSIANDNTASQTWPFGPVSLAAFFGGSIPVQFVYFVSHNAHTSTNVWSATEGDHAVRHTPIYLTVA